MQVRNAEPYREFQSSEDNDRYYGMNEVLICVSFAGSGKCVAGLLEEPGSEPSQPAARSTACCTPGKLQTMINNTQHTHTKSINRNKYTNKNTNTYFKALYWVHRNLFIQGAAGATSEEIQFRHKRVWGYVYRWTTFTEIRFLVLSTTQTGAFIFVVFIDKSLGPQSMKCLMYETHVWRAS